MCSGCPLTCKFYSEFQVTEFRVGEPIPHRQERAPWRCGEAQESLSCQDQALMVSPLSSKRKCFSLSQACSLRELLSFPLDVIVLHKQEFYYPKVF
jgi:hypothetical protein